MCRWPRERTLAWATSRRSCVSDTDNADPRDEGRRHIHKTRV